MYNLYLLSLSIKFRIFFYNMTKWTDLRFQVPAKWTFWRQPQHPMLIRRPPEHFLTIPSLFFGPKRDTNDRWLTSKNFSWNYKHDKYMHGLNGCIYVCMHKECSVFAWTSVFHLLSASADHADLTEWFFRLFMHFVFMIVFPS